MTTTSPAIERVSDEYHFTIVPARDDIDELGHVSNLVYLRFVQEAAKRHSHAVGWDHAAYLRAGAVFVVRRHEIDYLAPAYEGDTLGVTTWIASWSAATSLRRTSISREGREIAKASTLWAFVTTDAGRPRRIGPEVREAFARKDG